MKILVVLILAATAWGQKEPKPIKARAWQTGKVLESERQAEVSGSTTTTTGVKQPGVYSPPTYGPPISRTTVHHDVYQMYVIEAEKHVYVAYEEMRWRWSKPAVLVINAPVKFAIEKKALYLIDDEGKEHKAAISKQILREIPTPQQ